MSTKLSRLEKRLQKALLIFAGVLSLFPLILLWSNNWVMRKSISNYAYADNSPVFFTLLTASCIPFLIDGIWHNKKYYNIILALSLIGIALTPHNDYPLLHYFFTGVFFIYGAFVMIYYSSVKQRWFKIILGSIMALSLLLAFFWHVLPVFIAEWIGIVIYTFHFIGETLKKID